MFNNKYKPTCFADCIFPDRSIEEALCDLASGARRGNTLLYGPNGTGKSTLAQTVAIQLVKGAVAGDEQIFWHGTRTTAQKVENFLTSLGGMLGLLYTVTTPCVVIDEIDQLPQPVQRQLAGEIDKHGHLGIVIATTNFRSKLDPALLDRFDQIEIPEISAEVALARAKDILLAEGEAIPDEAISNVLKQTNGSMRDILRALESVCIKRRKSRAAAKSGAAKPY